MNPTPRQRPERSRVDSGPSLGYTCPSSTTDFKSLLAAVRPLGDTDTVARHAANCPGCFDRLCDLFLATAPDDSDPIHAIVDGFNGSFYLLAKALLDARPDRAPAHFTYDQSPMAVNDAVEVALDRLSALDEYSDGRITLSGEAAPLQQLIRDASLSPRQPAALAETILKRSISIGGRHGLDSANLLGFLRYQQGNLENAKLLFTTVIDRQPVDGYERETQAHAMNNLTGVHLGLGDLKSAILWCERSLMLKERLGIDSRSNYVNLLFFWLEQGTAYGLARARHYLRTLIAVDSGKQYLEKTVRQDGYDGVLEKLHRSGLDREFPELSLPPRDTQKTSELKQSGEGSE
ncbi:MAG: tetratricopeptide repeat protein [Planctomycetota bacterium]